MPLASPIGSGLGLLNPFSIRTIKRRLSVPVIVDAGVGTASDACLTMEQGVDGILMNTALAEAQDPVRDGDRDAARGGGGPPGVSRRPDAAARSGRAVAARWPGCSPDPGRLASRARRLAACSSWCDGGRPFDVALERALAGLADADRRLAHELAAGTLRAAGVLDTSLAPLVRVAGSASPPGSATSCASAPTS